MDSVLAGAVHARTTEALRVRRQQTFAARRKRFERELRAWLSDDARVIAWLRAEGQTVRRGAWLETSFPYPIERPKEWAAQQESRRIEELFSMGYHAMRDKVNVVCRHLPAAVRAAVEEVQEPKRRELEVAREAARVVVQAALAYLTDVALVARHVAERAAVDYSEVTLAIPGTADVPERELVAAMLAADDRWGALKASYGGDARVRATRNDIQLVLTDPHYASCRSRSGTESESESESDDSLHS
jgi:hypothetical protein